MCHNSTTTVNDHDNFFLVFLKTVLPLTVTLENNNEILTICFNWLYEAKCKAQMTVYGLYLKTPHSAYNLGILSAMLDLCWRGLYCNRCLVLKFAV